MASTQPPTRRRTLPMNSYPSSFFEVGRVGSLTQTIPRPASSTPSGVAAAAVAITGIGVASCWYIRTWRHDQIQALPEASSCTGTTTSLLLRNVDELVMNLARTGLMGRGPPSVKQQLDDIRIWHVQRGFKGALVVRDLEQPLYIQVGHRNTNDTMKNGGDENDAGDAGFSLFQDMVQDPLRSARRECYYLYYERTPTAQLQQQVFCRGTILWVDVLTCLQAWHVYDDELKARLHVGFRNHANRLVEDLIPLLAPPQDPFATMQVYGHSLGGAVACIVALKLLQRGYNVTRVVTVGAPRFCHVQDAATLSAMLPPETLRIEDDRDLSPFLPPTMAPLHCDKLWLMRYDTPRFIAGRAMPWWVDSVLVNFRTYEILSQFSKRHRVSSHIEEVKKIKSGAARKQAS